MSDPHDAPAGGAVDFQHTPHPRIRQRAEHAAPTTTHEREKLGLNGRIGLRITTGVGTMWCAYLFAVIGATGIVGALSNSTFLVLLVGSISGYFLQLVLLPIIIVGQNVQSAAADKRAQQTYADAEAILHECLQLQAHLQAQDQVLDDLVKSLQGGPAAA
ncbi:MAG: hypothetical protein ACYDAC_03660 [Candidatus Dormibacteria bacterium]